MRKSKLTDEDVEQEIKRLQKSPYVKLSRAEYAIRERRRQYLYNLRWHDVNGRRLAENGWSLDMADLEESGDVAE